MVCGNFILPEPASYVFFYAFFNLRKLLYIIAQTYTTVRRKLLLKLLRKIAAGTHSFSRYWGCGVLVVRSRRLTKHLHRLAIFLFVKLHGYIECIQKFFSGSRFVKQRIISNQAVSFQRIGVKGFNSILRQQSIIVAKIL